MTPAKRELQDIPPTQDEGDGKGEGAGEGEVKVENEKDQKTKDSPKKRKKKASSPSTPSVGSPSKRGEIWSEQEDAIITKDVNSFISQHHPDYDFCLNQLEAGGRTKKAIQLRWLNVLKPRLLAQTGKCKVEK